MADPRVTACEVWNRLNGSRDEQPGRGSSPARDDTHSLSGFGDRLGGALIDAECLEYVETRRLPANGGEELGIDTWESCLAPLTFASHSYADFHLLMPLYACRKWNGIAQGREGQHLALAAPARLSEYPMPPADIPLIPILRDWL